MLTLQHQVIPQRHLGLPPVLAQVVRATCFGRNNHPGVVAQSCSVRLTRRLKKRLPISWPQIRATRPKKLVFQSEMFPQPVRLRRPTLQQMERLQDLVGLLPEERRQRPGQRLPTVRAWERGVPQHQRIVHTGADQDLVWLRILKNRHPLERRNIRERLYSIKHRQAELRLRLQLPC